MSEDPELIKKLRQAAQETEQWPASMKKLHEIRQRADAYFSEKKKQLLTVKTNIRSGIVFTMAINRSRMLLSAH